MSIPFKIRILQNGLIIISLLLFNNCAINFSSVKSDYENVKLPKNRYSYGIIPVNVKRNAFDPTYQKESDNIYNSDLLFRLIPKTYAMKLDNRSNLGLSYKTASSKHKYAILDVLFIFTLGLFPTLESSDSIVQFEMKDRKNQRVLRTWRYNASNVAISSWLTTPFSLILSPFSDSVSTTSIGEDRQSKQPLKLLTKRFLKDFEYSLNDEEFRKELESIATIDSSTYYIAYPVDPSGNISQRHKTALSNMLQNFFTSNLFSAEAAATIEYSVDQENDSDIIQYFKMYDRKDLILVPFIKEKKDNLFSGHLVLVDSRSKEIVFDQNFQVFAVNADQLVYHLYNRFVQILFAQDTV